MMVTAKRARVTGLLVLVVIFVAGALTGAATMRVVSADEAPALRPAKEPPDLLDRLQLTPEQRVQVDAILERRRAQMEEFWDEHRPALRAITDSARAEMRAVLTPEQQAVEEEFRARRRDHMGRRDGKRSGTWQD
jgi:Spy/CpxP family protein refolding chaperone